MSANLDKLGKILALADEGSTPEERDAFMQKAEELAAVLGVELALARAHHANKSKREVPIKRTIKVGNERSKKNDYLVQLFITIAHPHDIKVTIGYRNIYVNAYGLPSDIDIVEALFGMSVIKMIRDADQAVKIDKLQLTAGRYGGPVDGRIYRSHFYDGFRSQLASRLWTARRDAIRANGGDTEAGDTGTDIILRDKAKEVEEFYEEDLKHWSRRTGSWKGPSTNGYIPDAIERGSKSASNMDLNLSPKIDNPIKGRLARS